MAVIDNREARRYEMTIDGQLAFADYRASGDVIRITHVEVPRALEGRGHGSRFMKAILAEIRVHKQKVIPLCSFAAAYIHRHPEEQDLLASNT